MNMVQPSIRISVFLTEQGAEPAEGFSDYPTDNAFVEAFLYEKKIGYFSFLFYSQRKNVFLP
jgi:hypothetical protein